LAIPVAHLQAFGTEKSSSVPAVQSAGKINEGQERLVAGTESHIPSWIACNMKSTP